MNRPRDDEYDSLRDMMRGGTSDDPQDPTADPADSDESGADEGAADEGGSHAGGDLPPGVPPEFAEAYRLGYERALRGEEPYEPTTDEPTAATPRGDETTPATPPGDEPTVRIDRGQIPGAGREPAEPRPIETPLDEPALRAEPESEPVPAPDDEPTQQIPVTQAAAPASSYDSPPPPTYAEQPSPPYAEGGRSDEDRRKRLVVIGLAALAVLVVVGAFGIGRLFADDAGESGGSNEAGGSDERAYEGPVESVTVVGGQASCQTQNSVDAAGNIVSYEPAKAYDSNLATAWRCDGSGRGERFTVTLPEETTVAEVGLVPGYAKTDPASGADRYAENNRITKVRWRFDDGSSYVQRMNGSPTDRDMRTMRVPETSTKRVVIEILASKAGPRNTVAISELRVASPAG